MGYVRTGEDQPEACPKCRFPVRREFNFCPSCGERLRDVCPNCRAEMESAWRFCTVCGTSAQAAASLGEPAREAFGVLAAGGEPASIPLAPSGTELHQEAEAHNTRGSELYEQDEYDEAIREFSEAVSLIPTNAIYHMNLAVALSEIGEYERAVREFQEALRLDPGNTSVYLQLGYTYQEMEKPRQAVECWKKVIEINPDSSESEEAREALESIGKR